MALALVADIGGTNARFALADPDNRKFQKARMLSAADFPDIAAAVEEYLVWCGARPDQACFAVACPAKEDEVRLTNSSWHFGRAELKSRFRWRCFETINDFEALALAVPRAVPGAFCQVRPGEIRNGNPIGLLGPGTGLGVSGLVPDGRGDWIALASEGGHVGFAPEDETEIEFLHHLRVQFGHVSAERVISGEGIANIHDFLAERAGRPHRRRYPADITSAALEGGDPLALETVHCFLAALGGMAGDLALTLGALGGIYIGGGIVPRLLPLLPNSQFLERFAAKGRMGALLQSIPIFVITDDHLALSGAAARLAAKAP